MWWVHNHDRGATPALWVPTPGGASPGIAVVLTIKELEQLRDRATQILETTPEELERQLDTVAANLMADSPRRRDADH
ncbi:hypothetical protein BKG81_15990 [Mycobacteroides chelonae]|nr:hypothetical protein BKG81_15990 [Mycobacteroides chelonae]